MAKVKDILGAREVATILKMSEPAGYCRGRAKGWWDANEPEYYAAYTSLVKLIARGEAK